LRVSLRGKYARLASSPTGEAVTSSALVFMLIVWSLVFGMAIYCYSKMFRSGQRFGEGPDPGERHGDSHDKR
jgi:hypothetical protein